MIENDTPTPEEKDTHPSKEVKDPATEEHLTEGSEETISPESASSPTGEEKAPEGKEEEKPKAEFEVTEVKDLPSSVKEYHIKLSSTDYDRELDTILKDLQSTTIIEGFRVGKAPMKLIKIRFGEDAKTDAINKLLPTILETIIERDELEILSDPELKESKVEGENPVELTLILEVRPQIIIEDEDYKELKVELKKNKIDNKAVNEQIESIRETSATYEEKEDGKYEEGDGLILDVTVTDDREYKDKNLTRDDAFLKDPKTHFPEKVAEALKGKKKGDRFEVQVENKRHGRRGELLSEHDTYAINIRDVRRRVLPELNDDFAKDLGEFENLAAVRKQVKEDLEKNEKERQRAEALEKIYDQILESKQFETPETLVRSQQFYSIQTEAQRLSRLGIRLSELPLDPDQYMKKKNEEAIRIVKRFLLLQTIAKRENITVTDEDVNKEIDRMAEESGRKPLAIRAALEARKELDSLKDNILFTKVTDMLYENAKIKNV